MNKNLVTISAKRNQVNEDKKSVPMIGLDESVEPASFQAFEISMASYCPMGTPALKPKVSHEVMSLAQEWSQ